MSLPPILNRALNAAYEGANEIIHFSKRIDNLEVIKKEGNDLTTNLDQIVESKVFDSLKTHYPDFDYYGEETLNDLIPYEMRYNALETNTPQYGMGVGK